MTYEPEVADRIVTEMKDSKAISIHTNYLLWVIVGLGVTFAVVIVLLILDRRHYKIRKARKRRMRK